MPGDSSLFDIPPQKFGRYRVQHQIGVGATGPVFRADDPDTHAPLAIKALRTYLPPEVNPQVVDDLIAVIDRLPSHPCILAIRAAGLEDEEPYFVTDLASGEGLDDALKKYGPGAVVDLLPRLRSIADALDLAAEHGLCHGALHPRDVIVSEHSTFVTGIGVAEILGRRGIGVPIRRPYTAPEIGRGDPPIAASDQFSLAALTFEWFFGELITGPAYTPLEVPALPGLNRDELSDAFTTALASEPSARFANCRAFVDGLFAAVPALARPPVRDRLADVPLRIEPEPASPWDDDGDLDTPLVLENTANADLTLSPSPSFSSRSMFAAEQRDRGGFGLGALAATLLLGMAVGSGGGYFASTRLWPTSASAVPPPASMRPGTARETPPAAASPSPPPEFRQATDVPVAPTPSPSEAKNNASSPEPKKDGFAVGRSAPIAPVRSARVEPGSLVVDSRPPGAAVTINGIPRGKTPLSIDRVTPGDYIVTMRLTRFRPVSMAVHVAAGERARAAASLTLVNKQEHE